MSDPSSTLSSLPPKLVATYGWEIRRQVDLADVAKWWLTNVAVMTDEQAVRQWGYPKESVESVAAHAFLAHAANVSKILFPAPSTPNRKTIERVGGKGSDGAARLQALFAARQGGELVRTFDVGFAAAVARRDLRDHLEHYDERLEVWAVLTPTFLRLEGRPEHADELEEALGYALIDKHRRYDSFTSAFSFWDEEYKLDDIANELRRIREKVADWLMANTDWGRWLASRGGRL